MGPRCGVVEEPRRVGHAVPGGEEQRIETLGRRRRKVTRRHQLLAPRREPEREVGQLRLAGNGDAQDPAAAEPRIERTRRSELEDAERREVVGRPGDRNGAACADDDAALLFVARRAAQRIHQQPAVAAEAGVGRTVVEQAHHGELAPAARVDLDEAAGDDRAIALDRHVAGAVECMPARTGVEGDGRAAVAGEARVETAVGQKAGEGEVVVRGAPGGPPREHHPPAGIDRHRGPAIVAAVHQREVDALPAVAAERPVEHPIRGQHRRRRNHKPPEHDPTHRPPNVHANPSIQRVAEIAGRRTRGPSAAPARPAFPTTR